MQWFDSYTTKNKPFLVFIVADRGKKCKCYYIYVVMSISCLNCGTEFDGNFCPNCGQKAHTERITLMSILHEIPHSIFHVDKGFFYTFIQLLRRPGKAIRECIAGKRVKYYGPFAYLFIMSALSSLAGHLAAEYLEKYKHIHISISPLLLFPAAAVFFSKYLGLMFSLFIPFISFWSWLFNRDSKYNYWENLVMNTYLIAQFNLFLIIEYVLVIMNVLHGSLTPIFIVFFSYIGFAYFQFFQSKMTGMLIAKRVLMFIMIIFTMLTGLSLTFMTPWWY